MLYPSYQLERFLSKHKIILYEISLILAYAIVCIGLLVDKLNWPLSTLYFFYIIKFLKELVCIFEL